MEGTIVKLRAKLPKDDAGAQLMRFEGVRGQRYTEIFIIGGNVMHLVGGVYNTIGLNESNGTGDSCPQAVLDKINRAWEALLEEMYNPISGTSH